MLGGIIKSTEALRFHAKSAEIAGQNLSHVDDQNYARQRVLSREGLMFKGNGGLNTGALEGSGLDHSRNELLDKRVFEEFGETASLETEKEMLTLLQAALGETVVRQNVDGTLDLDNTSNLAEGGLARALDDFFNSFMELSSSPDEASAKQEVFQKISTLTKRFNDAGQSLDRLESDIGKSVQNSVSEANDLLEKIYETNVQIKRFELLGQGKAVTYIDTRQKLLEDLSKLLNFKIEPEIDQQTGRETGFLNLLTSTTTGASVEILSSANGVQKFTQDFGQALELSNQQGAGALVQAKFSKGTLGQVEVLKGGSQYNDEDGPILVSFAPPVSQEDPGEGKTLISYTKGDVFSTGGKLYQVLKDSIAGTTISGNDNFLTISTLPENGQVFPETLRRFSDLETFKKGEVIYYEGKVLQVVEDFGPSTKLDLQSDLGDGQVLAQSYSSGEVVELNGSFYELSADISAGSSFPTNLPLETDQELNGFILLDPATSPEGKTVEFRDAFITQRNLEKGEVVEFDNTFFQLTKSVSSGTELSGLLGEIPQPGEKVDGVLLVIGEKLPQVINELSYVPKTITNDGIPTWYLSKSYQKDEVVKFGDDFFKVTADTLRETEISELANFLQFGTEPATEDSFDNVFEKIDDPNGDFIFSNGSYYLTDPSLPNSNALALVGAKVQSLESKADQDVSTLQNPVYSFKQNEIYYQESNSTYFTVTSPIDLSDLSLPIDVSDEKWKGNFKEFVPQLASPEDPFTIVKKSYPVGHNLDSGNLVELNVGMAEAVVKQGEIVGFNVLNAGSGLPQTDSIFSGGLEIQLESGEIKGYQISRTEHLEDFRLQLNDMVGSLVSGVNEIYNPDDEQGSYIFGFDAILTRPVAGQNLLMEEEYGYFGREGDSRIKLYRDEVEMFLPSANEDTFSVVNTTPIFPEDFAGQVPYYRGGGSAETTFRSKESGDLLSFYGSARRMQYVTMENDDAFAGEDLVPGTDDDGRSMMLAYKSIPFRLEGLEDGSKLPIIGDNFKFSALPANPWNLAASLRLDDMLSAETLLAGDKFLSGSNNFAQSIAELGNGDFVNQVAVLNSGMGSKLSDLKSNIEHQQSVESLLLDQRRAVSSVNIDEEVANLMRFQRSFQASSRVLSTLDKMLEIVVMGLIR